MVNITVSFGRYGSAMNESGPATTGKGGQSFWELCNRKGPVRTQDHTLVTSMNRRAAQELHFSSCGSSQLRELLSGLSTSSSLLTSGLRLASSHQLFQKEKGKNKEAKDDLVSSSHGKHKTRTRTLRVTGNRW